MKTATEYLTAILLAIPVMLYKAYLAISVKIINEINKEFQVK